MLIPMRRLCSTILAPLLTLLACPASHAAPVNFSDVVTFGDSLSDVGNTASHPLAVLASFFGDDTFDAVTNGRFSNGSVWVEYLSTKLGLPGSASQRSDNSGDNYAHGGARTGSGTLTLGVIDNVGRQVSNYTNARTPTGNELFILWAGGNDLLDNANSPATIRNNMASHITALANDGAQRFLVLNLPLLGNIPRNLGTANQSSLNNSAAQYNDLIETQLVSLQTTLGIDITLFDVESTFNRLQSEPATFGFTNTTQSAFSNNAADPDTYVFWDTIHPTTAAHKVLADAAFVALHDPGDYTGDGVVDQADLQIVLSHYNQPTSPYNLAQGDWDGDGHVSIAEIDLVLAHWTQGPPPTLSVPEPVSVVLVGFALLMLAGRSGDHRK